MAWQFGPGPYWYDPNQTPVPQGGRSPVPMGGSSPAPFSPRPVQANGNLPDPMWRGWVNNPAAQPQISGGAPQLPGGGTSLMPYKNPGQLIDNMGFNGGQGVLRTMARGALGKALGPLSAFLGSTTPANSGEKDIYARGADGSVAMTPYGKNITSGGDFPLHNGFGPVVPFSQSPMGQFFSSLGHNMVGAARDNAGLGPDPSLEAGAAAPAAPANASAVPSGAMAAAFNTLGGPPNASPVPQGAMAAALHQLDNGSGPVPLPPTRPTMDAAARRQTNDAVSALVNSAAPNPSTNPYGFADSPAYMGQGSTGYPMFGGGGGKSGGGIFNLAKLFKL